jgi:hypothetical protein
MQQLTVQQQQWLDQQVTGLGAGTPLSFSAIINSLFQLGGVVVNYTSNATANTADTVAHTLGRVPVGYVIIQTTKAGHVYNGGTSGAFSATAANIVLKSDIVSEVAVLLVF